MTFDEQAVMLAAGGYVSVTKSKTVVRAKPKQKKHFARVTRETIWSFSFMIKTVGRKCEVLARGPTESLCRFVPPLPCPGLPSHTYAWIESDALEEIKDARR